MSTIIRYFFSTAGAGVLEAWLHKLMSQVDTTLSGYKILQPGANGVQFFEEDIITPGSV